ncbi:hypothetical protein [Mesorhizobium sp.]|uniref:hypothetical protein n=1 Tax=Mesorhizobium sp. TaxID=1871066 RepID=UPI0025E2CB87|nr:hypothetical protein [Mesorhizobium sp.]
MKSIRERGYRVELDMDTLVIAKDRVSRLGCSPKDCFVPAVAADGSYAFGMDGWTMVN